MVQIVHATAAVDDASCEGSVRKRRKRRVMEAMNPLKICISFFLSFLFLFLFFSLGTVQRAIR